MKPLRGPRHVLFNPFLQHHALKAVPSRISKQKQKQVCTSHTECVTKFVTFVTVTHCHKIEFATEVFPLFFLSKQVWSHFGHACHKWSHFQMWLVQTCFCFSFWFDWNGSEWTKYGKIYQIVSSVSVFCLESGLERLSTAMQRNATRCNTLQHAATQLALNLKADCNAETNDHRCAQHTATHCNILQYTAMHCNTMQYVAFTPRP